MDSRRLDLLGLHRNHVSVAPWIRLFVPSSEVIEVVGSEVEFDQYVQFVDQLCEPIAFYWNILLEFVNGLKDSTWYDVVVDPSIGDMAHVEAFAYSFDRQYADVSGQLII